jgi:hypothetical protein
MEGHERSALSSADAGKTIFMAFDGGRLTSDAGVLLLAEIERRLGIAERLARCIEDPHSPSRVHHTLAVMIRFRVQLIAAGYPDANDCENLHSDPVFRIALGRAPESRADLCSQPTISRLENLTGSVALNRMMAAMIELFCDSFTDVANRIVPDIDNTKTASTVAKSSRSSTLMRRPLLPAGPHSRGTDRQAGVGDPPARQDPGRGRGWRSCSVVAGAAVCRRSRGAPRRCRRIQGSERPPASDAAAPGRSTCRHRSTT